MRLFALTFGDHDSASTYYRLFQYEELLAGDGIEFDWEKASSFDDYKRLSDYDVVILQKTIVSASKLKQIRRYAKRLVYDADDRIWLRPLKKHHWLTRIRIDNRMRHIARAADLCTTANQVIAKDIVSFGGQARVVPMAVDTSAWYDCSDQNSKVVVGWSGAPKNTVFLRTLAPALIQAQALCPEIEFRFHSGQDPQVDGLDYVHIPYQAGREAETLCGFDVGLLPLPNDPFAMGKSPIKSLQYMASGAAIVSSPIGAAMEVVRDGVTGIYADQITDWSQAISRLARSKQRPVELSNEARRSLDEYYSTGVIYKRWTDLISSECVER